jgi:hypothetical protein
MTTVPEELSRYSRSRLVAAAEQLREAMGWEQTPFSPTHSTDPESSSQDEDDVSPDPTSDNR